MGLATLALGSIVFLGVRSEATQTSAPRDEQAVPRDVVAALGRIEPYSEIINLGAGSPSDRLDSLLVERGDLVKKSQVLGYLGGYAEQIAQRDVFKAQLDEARLRLKTEIDLDRARIEAAEVYQKQVLEVEPQGIAAQEATIASLEAKLANDKSVLDAQQQLMARGTGTRRQTEDQNSLVLQDEANLNAARARLSGLNLQFVIDKINADVQIRHRTTNSPPGSVPMPRIHSLQIPHLRIFVSKTKPRLSSALAIPPDMFCVETSV